MAKVKAKRNKAYNPNKISNTVALKAKQNHFLWMQYDNNVVDAITNKWLETNSGEDVPTKLLYPHIKGDLIIAIKHRLIDFVQKWTITMTLNIRNVETDEAEEVEVDFQLPECHLQEVKSADSNIKIDRGHGLKSRWKGLDKELAEALKPLEEEGFICESTFAYISVNSPFKSKEDYSYFMQEKQLRLTLCEMVA